MKTFFREIDQFFAEYMPQVTRRMFFACCVIFLVMTLLYVIGLAAPIVVHLRDRIFVLRPSQAVYQFHLWQFFTCIFAHFNFFHLFFNMIGLAVFGPMVENALGSTRFAWLAILSGLAGAFAHTVITIIFGYPSLGLLGFSGALYGILTFAIILFPRAEIIFWFIPMQLRILGFFFGILLMLSLIGDIQMMRQGRGDISGVSYLAHAAGVLAGILLYKFPAILRRLEKVNLFPFTSKKQKGVRLSMGHPGRHTDPDDRYNDPHWRLDQ